jgi:hypothetical protein
MGKKILLPLIASAFIAFSCADEAATISPTCKECEIVVTDTDTGEKIVSNAQKTTLCGEDLEKKQKEAPIIHDGIKSEWVCR